VRIYGDVINYGPGYAAKVDSGVTVEVHGSVVNYGERKVPSPSLI
jgi:hypothetical protein